jgi:cysteinyl-tRNA synthetase
MGDKGTAGPFVDAPVRLFNSRGRRTEEFTPLRSGTALVYTCGPTVYDYALWDGNTSRDPVGY